MVIRVLVLALVSLFFLLRLEHASANQLYLFPGFLGDSLVKTADDGDTRDANRDVTRAGWDLPEFRSFPSMGLTVPDDKHPGAVRFYEFMDYLVFKRPGILRATLALNCSEQELTIGKGAGAVKKTRRQYAEAFFDDFLIPREVFWLAAQESGLQDRARSPVGAYGAWQFMPETGRRFGVPGEARANFLLATPAAAKYLSYLNRLFADWGLAMAAYNSGEGNVGKAVTRVKHAQPGFWDIYRNLPSETRDYVPAILAWTRVALDPARFGFKPDGKACKQFTGW